MPGRGDLVALRPAARFNRAARPVPVVRIEEREVEEPLAGIIDDVEGQRRRALAPARRALVLDVETQAR